VDTHIIEIEKKVPIISLSGPSEGSLGVMNTFTATVVPNDVMLPITYTWQASGQSVITHTTGLNDNASFVWEYPGTQVITVTAENVEGSSIDKILLAVLMPPLSVEVSGSEAGRVDESYLFTATVDPITTTIPITYVWSVDGEVFITQTGGIIDSVMLSWEKPGVHLISMTASNPVGIVGDMWIFTVYIRVYMPINLRH
jgi:hypothetical protein